MEDLLRNASLVTVTLQYGNAGHVPPLLSRKLVLLDGQTAWALESMESKDMCMESGDEFVFSELDQRFLDNVATDRMSGASGKP